VIGFDIDAEPEQVRVDVVRYANAAADLLEASFDEAVSFGISGRLRLSQILAANPARTT
jgi:hypothetical protein